VKTVAVTFDNNPNIIAEVSPDTELAYAKFVQTQAAEYKKEINGKVKELEAKENIK